MPGLSDSKKKLRNFFLGKRKALSTQQVNNKSALIIGKIFALPQFHSAMTVHTYVPIKKNNEVDTFPLIKECMNRDKRVVVPKIAGEAVMEHMQLTTLKELEKNNWGVPEPNNNRKVLIEELDIVIVPMVAGDRYKNRLGYGKGFYDRFLKNCSAFKVGLLFDCQVYERELPVETFDIPLDLLITESYQIQ